MGLESATYINDLVSTNPTASDLKSQGDDQIRLNKSTSKNTFPGFTGAVMVGGVFSGTASAHVLTPATALPSYTAQTFFTYTPTAVNTGACTVNVSGLGAKSIKTVDGSDPTAGDIPANKSLLLQYDGTNMILIAGGSYVAKTGNSTITGNITLIGNQTISGTLAVTGALTGASMDAKGNVAGQIWAGAQDFTSATLTAATQSLGDSSTKAATTAFVAGTAFSSTLPAQTGNAGKFLTTDGTNASWGGSGGATETTSAIDITLTSSSQQAQAINMTASGKSVTLPDATTLSLGSEVFSLIATGYPFNVKNSAGTLLTAVAAGQTVTMALLNKAVAAGTWAAAASVTAGGSVSAGAYFNGAANAITGNSVGMLDTVTGIMVAGEATNLVAYVLTVDGSGIKYGTSFTIAAIANVAWIKVVPITATKAIVAYRNPSTTFMEFVCLTAGANLDPLARTITAGTILTPGTTLFDYEFGAIAVTATQALFSYYNGSNWIAFVINESSTTLTKGTEKTLAAGGFGFSSAITKLTASKFLITSTNNELVAVVADVSGSTVTNGTKYQLAATGYSSLVSAPIGISATKAVIIASNITTNATDLWTITIATQTISSPSLTAFGTYRTNRCRAVILPNSKALLVQEYYNLPAYLRASVVDLGVTPVIGRFQDIPSGGASQALYGAALVDSNRVITSAKNSSSYTTANILEIGAAI